MKKIAYTLFMTCCLAIKVIAQPNINQPFNSYVEKEVLSPPLRVVPNSPEFVDFTNIQPSITLSSR